MKEPAQWVVKQHLEKYPKCEWLCTHTNRENLGEKLEMEELPKLNELKQELSDALERSCQPYGLDESDQMADAWDDMVNATYEVTQLAIDKAVAAYEQKIQEFAVETLVHSKVFEWAESNSFPHRNQNPHVGGEGLGYQSAQQYVLDQLPIWRAEALAALQLNKEENK